MKFIVLFAFVALAAAQDYYTTLNDNLNVAAILANPVELRAYLDCFEDKGPCTDLAYSFKKNMREAIQQACRRCNTKQKFIVYTFLNGMKRLPQELAAFKNHYDPENKYFDALEREVDILPMRHLHSYRYY